MLTPREAFKVGFLVHCAKLGMGSDEIEEFAKTASALVKQGYPGQELVSGATKGIGSLLGGAGEFAKGLGTYGLATALLAPPAAGYIGGYSLGKLTDVDDEDVDSIKQQEIIDEYMRNAERLRHRNRNFRSLRRQ